AKNTRLYVEASFFLGVCLLRRKKVKDAKALFRGVLGELNKVKSDRTRRVLQKRIVERVEEEAVLAGLTGVEEGILNPAKIHEEAIRLIQKPEDEVFEI